MAVASPLRAVGGEIERKRVDQMNIDYIGMDFNDDGIADSARINIVKNECKVFLGTNGRPEILESTYLSEEEERFFPDVVLEVDLDGDNSRDLLLANSRRLRGVWKNEKSLNRVLGEFVYLGQEGGRLLRIDSCELSVEARELILERAKQILLKNPALKGL
jgi:hypothetical protein